MTVGQVAALFGVSIWTVYRMCRSGDLPAVKIGGQWRISSDAVRARLAAMGGPA